MLPTPLTQGPEGMTIDEVTGLIQWTPAGNQLGPHDVEISVSDDERASTSQSFSISRVERWRAQSSFSD